MTADIRGNSGIGHRLEAASTVGAQPDAVDTAPAAGVTAESSGPSCGDCRFYLPRRRPGAGRPVGLCRLEPGGIQVESFDWCSHHAEKH